MRHFSKDTVQITTARVINERNKEFWNNRSRNFGLKLTVALEEDVKDWDINKIVDKMILEENKLPKKKAVKIPDYNKRSIEF